MGTQFHTLVGMCVRFRVQLQFEAHLGAVGPDHGCLRSQAVLDAQLQGVMVLAEGSVVFFGLEASVSFFLELAHRFLKRVHIKIIIT